MTLPMLFSSELYKIPWVFCLNSQLFGVPGITNGNVCCYCCLLIFLSISHKRFFFFTSYLILLSRHPDRSCIIWFYHFWWYLSVSSVVLRFGLVAFMPPRELLSTFTQASMLFLMLDLPFFMSLPLIGFPFYPSGHPEKNEHWKCPYSPLMLDWQLDRPRFLHRIFILHDEGIDPLFLAFLLPLRNMMYSDSCFFGLVFLNFFSNPLEAARIILSKVFWNYKHVVISLHLLCGN